MYGQGWDTMNEGILTKQKQDLDKLVKLGYELELSMLYGITEGKEEKEKSLKFKDHYETWYSEAGQLIKLLLPDRHNDFIQLYRNDKRKELNSLTYSMYDYMLGVSVTHNGKVVVDGKAAYPKLKIQISILEAVIRKFESSLFEIRQIVQADLFDNELQAAEELVKNGFLRGAGAVAGVVLEKQLAEVASNHNVKLSKRNPCIADYNDLLKSNEIIDVSTWRFIQRLGDIRNLCGHNKEREPEKEEVQELIQGVSKIIKTIY